MSNAAVLIPTWRRPKAMIRLFKKCPDLNSPHTYVGMEKKDLSGYLEWQEVYANRCTVVEVSNPSHYCSNAHQQIKEAVPLNKYKQVVFTDDNATFTNVSLQRLLYAHSLYPSGIVNGNKPIAAFYNKDKIEKGIVHKVPKPLQSKLDCKTLTTYEQLNMTFWVMPAYVYEGFSFTPNNYAWDIEVIMWAVLEGGVRAIRGCLEAAFEKHKHDFTETQQTPARKLKQLGESICILADRFPQQARADWMTYHVDIRKVMKDLIVSEK